MPGDHEQDRYPGQPPEFGPGRAVARAPERGYPTPYPAYEWFDEDAQRPSGLDLQKYIRILIRHWLVVAACVIVAAAAGLTKIAMTTPIYTATVRIEIQKETARVSNMQTFEAPQSGSSAEFFQTQYGLITSRALAETTAKDPRLNLVHNKKVLKALGIDVGQGASAMSTAQIQNALTDRIKWYLSVTPVQTSRLVDISYSSPDAAASAAIVNAVAQNYIETSYNRKFDSTANARRILQESLANEKAKLEQSERQLAEYARAQQIVNVAAPTPVGGGAAAPTGSASGNQSLVTNSLSAMMTNLNNAQAARIRAEQRAILSRSANFEQSAEINGNALIQQLRKDKAKLDQEYREALRTYNPQLPAMQQMREDIATIDAQIKAEIQGIATSLQSQYQVALAEEKQLQARVSALTSSALDLRTRSIQYDILQREIDTSRQLYEGMLQSFKEIGVGASLGTNSIWIVDPALPPGGPSKPQPVRIMITALFMGLVIGVGIAFLIETLDESVRSPEDVEKKVGLPLLGTIPKLEKGTTPIVALADVRSNFSEAYYSVRTALQFSTNDGAPSSIVVTSARPSEGKSTSSTAIAQNFARLGSRVLLIDSDLRNPSLHKVLNAENTQGFSNYLTGHMSLDQLAQQTSVPGLSFIPCGPMPPNPAELLGSAKLEAMLREAQANYDLVLIDAPPVMGLADAPLLASAAAGTLLVMEAGGTGRKLAKAAIRRLAVGNARILGILLTKFDARKSSYGYGYGYAYEYEYGSRPAIKAAN